MATSDNPSEQDITHNLLTESYVTMVTVGPANRYMNSADSQTDVVGEASQELAELLLVIVTLLILPLVTLYAVKRCYIRFITLPAISLVFGEW